MGTRVVDAAVDAYAVAPTSGVVRGISAELGRSTTAVVGPASNQLATIGLAAVLVLLAGFSLWAAVRTNAAARQVDRDSAEQEVWQNARAELAKAESAAHAYVEHQWPGARAELSRATQGLRDGLQFIEQHADPDDVEFAQQVRTGLARYLEATRWLLAAAAAGDTARVHALEAREVEPALAELADQLAA
jgi:hypothetical protein